MKKVLALVLSLTLVMSLLVACGSDDKKETETSKTPEATTAPATNDDDKATTAAAVKTGLAVINDISGSKDAADADGLAQVNSTVVAVTVGADGKIVKAVIDTLQTKVNFSKEGKIVTDLASEFKTKQELKDEYGMRKNSGIGKEWNEQADAFAAYVVGKTVDEVKGIAIDEEARPTDADLSASVTIHINELIAGVEKAVANAQDLGATDTDKLGLAITSNIAKSKEATAEAAGLVQAYTHYAAVTTDANGKITSSVLDASQGNVNFDATGVITSDLAVAPQTKQEIKEGYGMKAKSAIGKEWYEQANSFAAYVMGKTAAEVSGIAMTEGYAADADLKSSVTVHVTDFVAVVAKAVANAQ